MTYVIEHNKVERASSSISAIRALEVEGRRRRGRPRKTLSEVVKEDLKSAGLAPELAADSDVWRNRVQNHVTSYPPSIGT